MVKVCFFQEILIKYFLCGIGSVEVSNSLENFHTEVITFLREEELGLGGQAVGEFGAAGFFGSAPGVEIPTFF